MPTSELDVPESVETKINLFMGKKWGSNQIIESGGCRLIINNKK